MHGAERGAPYAPQRLQTSRIQSDCVSVERPKKTRPRFLPCVFARSARHPRARCSFNSSPRRRPTLVMYNVEMHCVEKGAPCAINNPRAWKNALCRRGSVVCTKHPKKSPSTIAKSHSIVPTPEHYCKEENQSPHSSTHALSPQFSKKTRTKEDCNGNGANEQELRKLWSTLVPLLSCALGKKAPPFDRDGAEDRMPAEFICFNGPTVATTYPSGNGSATCSPSPGRNERSTLRKNIPDTLPQDDSFELTRGTTKNRWALRTAPTIGHLPRSRSKTTRPTLCVARPTARPDRPRKRSQLANDASQGAHCLRHSTHSRSVLPTSNSNPQDMNCILSNIGLTGRTKRPAG